jgi:ABC-type multidrug transport system fused ATPase/permease subunit
VINTPFKRYWLLLVEYLKPQSGQLVILSLLLVGSIVTRLINPQIVGHFIDMAKAGSQQQMLLNAAVLFMGIAVVEQILVVATAFFSESVGWAAANRLREDLALHCLKLDLSFHKTRTPGEMIERIDGDVNELTTFFSQFVLILVGHSLLLLGILALLWRVDWRIGLSVTLVVASGLFAVNHLRQVLVPYWQVVQQANADLFGFLEERFNGLEEIRANNATEYVMWGLYRLLRRVFEQEYRTRRLFVITIMAAPIVFGLAYGAAFLWGKWGLSSSGLSVGMVYTTVYYLELLLAPFWEITGQIQSLQRIGASINRIEELKFTESRIRDGQGISMPTEPFSVTFEDVSFYYHESAEGFVLEDINFHLESGKVLGLIGRTGSGKTTLTRLLFRFHDVRQGMIRLGDDNGCSVDIRQMKLSQLRQRIGLVTQNVHLFQASVRDNVTLFDPTIPDARILSVIEELMLGDWLVSLPNRLNTVLAPGGGNLSAGQAQLLAFVRVFLQNPGLVILDEASSRLDYATERLIEKAVSKLFENRTGILIAHRLETLKRVDEIMVLENGRIYEYGSRDQLMDNVTSRYHQLLQSQ